MTIVIVSHSDRYDTGYLQRSTEKSSLKILNHPVQLCRRTSASVCSEPFIRRRDWHRIATDGTTVAILRQQG